VISVVRHLCTVGRHGFFRVFHAVPTRGMVMLVMILSRMVVNSSTFYRQLFEFRFVKLPS
jgi:hypothetical protein